MSIPVSVVVVSRDRPDALYRCILGLSQVQYSPFEIVVVADAVGIEGLSQFEGQIRTILFEEANISAARNVGISHATGEIIAFIDDDAVPEPTWLSYLTAPFSQQTVSAVGGFVRGRNGISFQWKARVIDSNGDTTSVVVDETRATVLTPPSGYAVKTEGTNMAVRRNVLVDLDGFDSAYHFYLDETDLNIRLSQAGYATAIAPLAQVHHGFASSIRRRADRVPRDLFDIGASWAVFQRKYIGDKMRSVHWQSVLARERKRVLQHMISGGLEPRDVLRLMRRLDDGYLDGQSRKILPTQISVHLAAQFLPMRTKKRTSCLIVGRLLYAKQKRNEAIERVGKNEIITILFMSPTALYHHVRFHKDGYWEQIGGLFGKSARAQKLVQFWTRRQRADFESQRVDSIRFGVNADKKSTCHITSK